MKVDNTLTSLVLFVLAACTASTEPDGADYDITNNINFDGVDDYDYEDLEDPYETLFNDISGILDSCRSNTTSGLSEVFDNADPETILELALAHNPDQCSPAEIEQFDASLAQFKVCTDGIDIKTFFKEMPSAFVGSWIECFVGSHGLLDGYKSDKQRIKGECREHLFGQNPLGDFTRSIYLYPDKVLPCFVELSEAVPSCTYDTWPIPLFGPLIQVASCVLGNTDLLINDICEFELRKLDLCLPKVDLGDDMCQQAIESCTVEDEGNYYTSFALQVNSPYQGAPLPDACVRSAKGEGLQDAVARYEKLRSQCFDDWQGWSYEIDSYVRVDDGTYTYSDGTNTAILGFVCFIGGGLVTVLLVALVQLLKKKRMKRAESSDETKEAECAFDGIAA